MTHEPQHRIEIDWLKTAAGALAAVSSAVLLSTLGAAGTIIGAALGSVIITLGSTIYTQGLARGRQRLAQAQAQALRRVGVAQAEVRRANGRPGRPAAAGSRLEHADESLERAHAELDAAARAVAPTWGARLAALPWQRITLIAGGLFLVAMLSITAFELIAGKSVANFTGGSDSTGGTSFSQLNGGGTQGDDPDQVEQEPVEDPSTGATPSDDASPSTSPSPSPSPSTEATQPTPSPTPSPSTFPEPDATPTSPLPSDTSVVPSESPG